MSATSLLKVLTVGLSKSSRELKFGKKIVKNKKGEAVTRDITLGEYYRKYSAASRHILDVKYSTISNQFDLLLKSEPSIVNSLGKRYKEFLDHSTKKFIENIKKSALARKFPIVDETIIIDQFKNNYDVVNTEIKKAANIDYAYDMHLYFQEIAKELDIDPNIIKISQDNKKFGFDVGHLHSNITSAYQSVVLNSIRRNYKYSDSQVPAIIEDLNYIINQFKDPLVSATIMKELKITDKELFNNLVESTLEYARDYFAGKINVILKTEPKLDKTAIKKIAEQVADTVFPQAGSVNQKFGATFEASLSRHLSTIGENYFLKFINDVAIGNIKGIPSLMDLSGSKSIREVLDEAFEAALFLGTDKKSKIKTKVKKDSDKKIRIPIIKKSKKVQEPAKSKVKLEPLRDVKGRFVSLTSISNLINFSLTQRLMENMGEPALVNRTGRFASSAKVERIEKARDNSLSIFYTYMKYPYGTFETGGKLGSPQRDPRVIIDKSIREIASSLVTAKLKTVRI